MFHFVHYMQYCLVIFKITIGLIVHSVAIQADGLNNLSDVGSNLASFIWL